MTQVLTNEAQDTIKAVLDRVENLETDKKNISDDIKEQWDKAKSAGLDVKILKQIFKERQMSTEDLREQVDLVDCYRHAAGINL